MGKAVVVILIDALGFDIVDRWKFAVKGLDKKARIKSVLGFSQAAILSIFTALSPKEHGKWLMYSFDADASPFRWTKFVPQYVSSERLWFRRAVNFKLRKFDKVTSYYSLYSIPRKVLPYLDLPLRKDYFQPGAINGVPTILDRLQNSGIRFRVWDFKTPEDEAFVELGSLIEAGEEGFLLLYTAELDSLLHRYGTDGQPVGEKLKYYGRMIEKLVTLASGKYEEVRFFVFGDHGMCNVDGTIDIMGVIEDLGMSIPMDYIPFYDSTMARFMVSNVRVMDRIRDVLEGVTGGRVLSDDECSKLGVPVPGEKFGHLLFLADTGNIILPSYMGVNPVSGMHGYHPESKCMDSVMLTNVQEIGGEMDLTDIAGLLLDDLPLRD